MMREEGSVNGGREAQGKSTRGTRGAGARGEHDAPLEANGVGTDAPQDDGDANEDDLGAGRASYGDDLDTLDRRRTEELKLIGEFDSANINPRRECWFIVDTKWLQSWAKFVRGEGPPPGRISNEALVKDDLKTPVDGLVSRVDYRGVNPAVWFLYLEMYGKDSAQDLCRYVIDLYEAEVPLKYRREIFEEPMRRAQVEVQKMRWRVEPEEARPPDKPRLCCCITEQTIDCIFMALFTCCAKWRRRCPRWLCCCCNSCCPSHGSASGGRYSRVTNGEEDGEGAEDYDSELDDGDDDVDFGAREEEEDLCRPGGAGRSGRTAKAGPPPARRNGTCHFQNGNIYTGSWKAGMACGTGTQTFGNGDRYEGEWKAGMMSGQGIYTYANGYVYDGEWERDEKNGKGRQIFEGVGGGGRCEEPEKVAAVEGIDWYEGQWKDGNHHGQGEYHFDNGDIYVGSWVEHRMEGRGTMVYGDGGGEYEGEFRGDARHGQGTRRSPSYTYEGAWAGDLQHGFGKLSSEDEGVYEGFFRQGTWKDGHLSGHATIRYKSGDRYTGGFEKGLRNGKGTMFSVKSGYEFTGTFENGVKNGSGLLRLPCGATVEGTWMIGNLIGNSKFSFPPNSEWKNPRY
eukprot:g12996.t1